MSPDDRLYISTNRLEGSLADTPISALLDTCHRSLITGTLVVDARGGKGTLELRAGAVDSATFDGVDGREAVRRLRALESGSYQLVQRLPDLDGRLGEGARFEGDIAEIPLIEVMRHCEDHALSCTIIVISGFDRAEIVYRAGDISEVRFNGARDDDRIVDVLRFEQAKFRVTAPPLSLGIEGWPVIAREPTAPFRHSRSLAKGTNAPPATSGDETAGEKQDEDDEPALLDPTVEVQPIRGHWHVSVWVGIVALVLALAVTVGLIGNALL